MNKIHDTNGTNDKKKKKEKKSKFSMTIDDENYHGLHIIVDLLFFRCCISTTWTATTTVHLLLVGFFFRIHPSIFLYFFLILNAKGTRRTIHSFIHSCHFFYYNQFSMCVFMFVFFCLNGDDDNMLEVMNKR